ARADAGQGALAAGDGRDRAVRRDPPDHAPKLIAEAGGGAADGDRDVGNVETAIGSEGDAVRDIESRARRRTAVAPVGRPVAGDGRDDAAGADLADATAAVVGDVEAAIALDREGQWPDRGGGGRDAVAVVVTPTDAGEGGDDPVRRHPADAVKTPVSDVVGAV